MMRYFIIHLLQKTKHKNTYLYLFISKNFISTDHNNDDINSANNNYYYRS